MKVRSFGFLPRYYLAVLWMLFSAPWYASASTSSHHYELSSDTLDSIEKLKAEGILSLDPTSPATKYTIKYLLGTGITSEVFLVRSKAGELCAAKLEYFPSTTAHSTSFSYHNSPELIEAEIAHQKACSDSPFVVPLLDYQVSADKSVYLLVFPYFKAGDLRRKIKKHLPQTVENGQLTEKRYFDDQLIFEILLQLFLAVKYIHNHDIFHSDIKPANVLLHCSGLIALGDFGLSVDLSKRDASKPLNQSGSPYFMAPEMASRSAHDGRKADVWSCGVLAFQLTFLRYPFQLDGKVDDVDLLLKKIINDPLPEMSGRDEQLLHLIKAMLNKDPQERCSINQALQHPFIRSRCLSFVKKIFQLSELSPEKKAAIAASIFPVLAAYALPQVAAFPFSSCTIPTLNLPPHPFVMYDNSVLVKVANGAQIHFQIRTIDKAEHSATDETIVASVSDKQVSAAEEPPTYFECTVRDREQREYIFRFNAYEDLTYFCHCMHKAVVRGIK